MSGRGSAVPQPMSGVRPDPARLRSIHRSLWLLPAATCWEPGGALALPSLGISSLRGRALADSTAQLMGSMPGPGGSKEEA